MKVRLEGLDLAPLAGEGVDGYDSCEQQLSNGEAQKLHDQYYLFVNVCFMIQVSLYRTSFSALYRMLFVSCSVCLPTGPIMSISTNATSPASVRLRHHIGHCDPSLSTWYTCLSHLHFRACGSGIPTGSSQSSS